MEVQFHKRSGVISIQHLRVGCMVPSGSGGTTAIAAATAAGRPCTGTNPSPRNLKQPLDLTGRPRRIWRENRDGEEENICSRQWEPLERWGGG